jgi:hypothetical protein
MKWTRLILFFSLCIVSFLGTGEGAAAASTVGKVFIDSGKYVTYDRKVSVRIDAPAQVEDMMISNSGDFYDASWEKYKKTKTWMLEYGTGAKTVFVRFRLKSGSITNTIHDTITLNPAKPLAKVELPRQPFITDERYVTVSTTLSNGIESFRYGTSKDLADEEYEDIVSRNKISVIIPPEKGKNILYIDFKDASGKVVHQQISVDYRPTGRVITEGSVLSGQDGKYYYYGYDGRLHMFPDERVFYSWYTQGVSTTPVSRTKIEQYKQGSSVCVRPGTYLLKFSGSKQVYIPESGCVLRPIRSTVEAVVLYGNTWNKRVIELASGFMDSYTIEYERVTQEDETWVDRDRDGVSSSDEDEYGTSDRKDDSDSDGLSDFEEIWYWFSDPISKDSDADGYTDAREILNGYSPIGDEVLTEVPPDTYMYPSGTVVRIKTGVKKQNLYYIKNATTVNSLGSKTNGKAFVSNHFQERFVVDPVLSISLSKKKGSVSSKEDLSITEPYTMVNGVLKKL